MPLTACRHVRKMRGGAQSHLLEADDGNFYVVKFRNNPQHRRILVNELVSAVFLKYLQVSAAPAEFIHVTPEFLAANPEIFIHLGTQHIPVAPGWHFGSRHPGNPEVMAVYDFVPDALLSGVSNLTDFLAVLVFDKWMANSDGRQSVFFRARVEDWQAVVKKAFVAVMIDHGFVFNGPNWEFTDSPLQGLYPRKMVTSRCARWTISSPGWLRWCISRKMSWTAPSGKFPRNGWKAKKTNSSNCWKSCCAAARAYPT